MAIPGRKTAADVQCAVRRLLANGVNKAQTARATGLSVPTVRKIAAESRAVPRRAVR